MLWQKTKNDLIEEMDTALQMPGWGNIFTQPIINRIEMLSTGVRTPDRREGLRRRPRARSSASARRSPRCSAASAGAADVVPDQIVGKGYVEIDIDREKAARYGIQVGDIQDVVEVAMGGKPLTMTVEGRERYPVRVRYARDFRDDVEALKRILVAARGRCRRAGIEGAAWREPGAAIAAAEPVQVPLAEVADVRVVEGPSMIKSENGLLRAYVQLNVRGPRRGRVRRGGPARRRREGEAAARACTSSGPGSSSTRSGPGRRCSSSSRPSSP